MLGYHFLAVLSFLLGVFLVSHLLRERRAPGSTAAWLLLMVFVPYVGVPLYLFFGGRKIKRVAASKRSIYRAVDSGGTHQEMLPFEILLKNSGVPPKVAGNTIEILSTGEEAYRELIGLLKTARERISITTFILELDSVGKSVVQVLEEKAREGVEVRLLLDGLGSLWTFPWRLKKLRKAGGQVSVFLPLLHVPFFGHSNLRNHRKMVVVDGARAVVGGMNISKDYMGPTPDPARWVDLSVKVSGPVVTSFEEMFQQDWIFAARNEIPKLSGSAHSAGSEVMQVVASGPDVSGDPLYDSIVSAIFSAKKSVWIATPYFIPDETLSKALEIAARRGVDVRLLVPKKSNHFLADLCRITYVRQLMSAGGKVKLLPGKMMHAKVLIVDDLHALVGSANLDMRSLLLNYELGLFIYSHEGIRGISAWFESLENETCEASQRPNSGLDLLGGLGRILGPIL